MTSGAPSEEVVAASARAAQKTFSNAIDDPVYAEAVALLVIVSQAGQGDDFASSLRRNGVAVETAPDLIGLLEAVGQRLDAAGRQGGEVSDVGSLARRALLGALYTSFSQELPGLFPEPADLPKAVRKFSSPAGFSELARAFFTRMTAETLAYWLDRTMGAQIGDGRRFQDAHDRNVFDAALSQFSAEATRIIKEFSAGWYAKNAFSNRGDLRERSKAYAAIAFKKINEELQRRVGDDA